MNNDNDMIIFEYNDYNLSRYVMGRRVHDVNTVVLQTRRSGFHCEIYIGISPYSSLAVV